MRTPPPAVGCFINFGMKHIMSGHGPNGNRGKNKSKFPKWMTQKKIKKAIEEAYKKSTRIQTQGDRVKIRGYSKTYNLIIEMWVNAKRRIIETAYPWK